MAIKLKDNRHRAPNNQWIVEKTLLSLNDHKPDSDQMLAAIYQFKHYLSKLPYRKLPLRRWTQDIELVRCHKQKQVLSVYKTKGADAALELIKSLNTESDLNYKDWLKIQ